jgi:hypothetical protein
MWGFVAHDKDVNEFSPPLRPLMGRLLPLIFPQFARLLPTVGRKTHYRTFSIQHYLLVNVFRLYSFCSFIRTLDFFQAQCLQQNLHKHLFFRLLRL